jgi:hypothetical protein
VNDKLPTRHTAWATWEPRYGTRGLTITRILDAGIGRGEMIAVAPMPGTGEPTRGQLDDTLAVIGYTRRGPWSTTTDGLVADVERIRPEGQTP